MEPHQYSHAQRRLAFLWLNSFNNTLKRIIETRWEYFKCFSPLILGWLSENHFDMQSRKEKSEMINQYMASIPVLIGFKFRTYIPRDFRVIVSSMSFANLSSIISGSPSSVIWSAISFCKNSRIF